MRKLCAKCVLHEHISNWRERKGESTIETNKSQSSSSMPTVIIFPNRWRANILTVIKAMFVQLDRMRNSFDILRFFRRLIKNVPRCETDAFDAMLSCSSRLIMSTIARTECSILATILTHKCYEIRHGATIAKITSSDHIHYIIQITLNTWIWIRIWIWCLCCIHSM